MRGFLCALLTLSTAGLCAASEPPTDVPQQTRERLGVFYIDLVGFEDDLGQTAVDVVATAIGETGRFEVVSSSEIKALLDHEARKQLLGCEDDATCLAEIGLSVGVEVIVAGTVTRIDGALTVSLQLIDTRTAAARNRVAFDWRGPRAGVSDPLAVAAELLVLPQEARQPGSVRLSGIGPEAAVDIDGEPRGAGPLHVEELHVGVHELTVVAPGFEPYTRSFAVRTGDTTLVALELVREDPFWKRWWFWTIAGAVVVGGTVTAVVLATGGEKTPPTAVDFRTSAPGVIR